MQVIYKKTICSQMDEAIEHASKQVVEIEKFVLNPFEYLQFGKEFIFDLTGINGLTEGIVLPAAPLKYRNIPVERGV